MSVRNLLIAAGVLGALAVACGAFAAHGLEGRLSARYLEVWQTAVRYHMWHTLAVLAVAASASLAEERLARAACTSWMVGIVLFSGSLYALCLSGIGALGMVTPIGGIALIIGWLLLVVAAKRRFRLARGQAGDARDHECDT